jgi:peptide/nickel transport system permease protein
MKTIWKGLWLDFPSALSMVWVGLISIMAAFAYLFAPVNTEYANEMLPELALLRPGSKAIVVLKKKENSSISRFLFGSETPYRLKALKKNEKRSGVDSYLLLNRVDEEANWEELKADERIEYRTFWLGTDRYGRDLLSRLIIGARISLAVGFIAVLISLFVGIPLGALAGFYGGRIDSFIQWFLQVVWSIPTLLLVIALTLALGKGFWQVFVAIGLTMWVEVARVVRGEVMNQKKREYVDAARVSGFSSLYILRKHVLPNSLAPLIVVSAANFAAAILVESGLSFLGLGAQPPIPSWGGIIKDHYALILMDKAWLSIAPGLLIMSLVLSFMLLGNRLRDILDVRSVQ